MTTIRPLRRLFAACALLLASWAVAPFAAAQPGSPDAPARPGLVFVNYRHLDGGPDGIALVDLDPESDRFGEVLQDVPIGVGVLPHHMYFDHDQTRVYNTALGGSFLYAVHLERDADGVPTVTSVAPIDTGANVVGEDMYFTRDGRRYYVTFLGGTGGDRSGSVGVFDARTDALLETIVAPAPGDGEPDRPFILYAHGISAHEDLGLLMVTSTIHPDLVSGAGNTVTTIDLASGEAIATHLVGDGPDDVTAPVEVLLLRDGLPPFALTTAMLGGDVWAAAYDAAAGGYGAFRKVVEGDDHGVSWPLKLYVHRDRAGELELYVTFAQPGAVHVYGLDALPELPLRRTLPAAAGAHHLVFFTTPSGREVVAVQNNLLALDGLAEGSLMVVDQRTGEVLGRVDLPASHGFLPESIESAYGHGHDYRH